MRQTPTISAFRQLSEGYYVTAKKKGRPGPCPPVAVTAVLARGSAVRSPCFDLGRGRGRPWPRSRAGRCGAPWTNWGHRLAVRRRFRPRAPFRGHQKNQPPLQCSVVEDASAALPRTTHPGGRRSVAPCRTGGEGCASEPIRPGLPDGAGRMHFQLHSVSSGGSPLMRSTSSST